MAYIALQLITKAYYLSQVVSRGLQVVSDEQTQDGLDLLNALLGFKSSDLRLIPYFTNYQFNTVQGQEKYVIPNLLEIETLTFNLTPDVRFSLRDQTRFGYFEPYRVDTIQSLPYQYRIERQLNGANIYLYFIPSQVFVMNLWGKFSFPTITLTTDLSTIFDPFYIEYLRYALASYICSDWGATFPDKSEQEYKRIEKKLLEVSPVDLSVHNLNYFGKGNGLNWAVINLSNGYLPY